MRGSLTPTEAGIIDEPPSPWNHLVAVTVLQISADTKCDLL